MANRVKLRFYTRQMLRLFFVMAWLSLFGVMFCPPLSKISMEGSPIARAACPSCACDCSTENELIPLPVDCGKDNPEINEEMDKGKVALLTEELELQKAVTDDTLEHKKSLTVNMKRASLNYQKEAEKCGLGMETCEEAREGAEAKLVEERRITALWERRAKELGWRDSRKVYT